MRSWRRVPSLFFTFVVLAGVASGCRDRFWDPGYQLRPPDGGGVDAPKVDSGARDHVTIDLTGFGGSTAGRGGSGGSGGGTGGTAARAAASPCATPTRPNARRTSPTAGPASIRACVPNSDPLCVAGVCRFNCFDEFFDADKDPTNGCECTKINAGVEACDGFDNNCNGTVDEGFNFMTDVANCGGCNVTCSFPFATSSCVNGVCQQGACLPGFYDRDRDGAGLRDRVHDVERRRRDLRRPGQRLRRRRSTTARWPARSSASRWASAPACSRPAWDRRAGPAATRRRRTRTSRTWPRSATRWTTTATAASTRRSRSARPARSARAPARTRTACGSATTACPPTATTAATARPSRPAPRPATAWTTTATARSTSSIRCRTAPATTS